MFKVNPSGCVVAGDVSQNLGAGDGDLEVSLNAVCVVEDLEWVGSSREHRKKEIRKEKGTTAGKC